MLVAAVTIGFAAGAASGSGDPSAGVPRGERVRMPGFGRVVFLSHVNSPSRTPVFPGDPAFTLRTIFTVPADGYYLQEVREGEHTGTHYTAPCHFHTDGRCADHLAAGDFVLPAVVVDVRSEVAADVDYHVSVQDLKAWETANGKIPAGAAVLLCTGCDAFWGPAIAPDEPTYYNCGSADGKFRQPGFSKWAVQWLIRPACWRSAVRSAPTRSAPIRGAIRCTWRPASRSAATGSRWRTSRTSARCPRAVAGS